MLFELEESHVIKANHDVLNISVSAFIEKNFELLIESLDELGNEQTKYQKFQKQLQLQAAQQQAWIQKRVSSSLLFFIFCSITPSSFFTILLILVHL